MFSILRFHFQSFFMLELNSHTRPYNIPSYVTDTYTIIACYTLRHYATTSSLHVATTLFAPLTFQVEAVREPGISRVTYGSFV